jgi:predicted flap endonuclease-1-like 5' DNA nuclease
LINSTLEAQDTISIPIVYVEAFVMMLGAFTIGYVGATLYERYKHKSTKSKNDSDIDLLKKEIQDLKEESELQSRKLSHRKDRMDQEYEQINFQKRAFSEDVLSKGTSASPMPRIDFERIGYASSEAKDDLQKITGIGPYTETKLNDLGIFTFEQISSFTEEDIKTVTKLIKFFPDRIKNDRWVSKAQQLKFNTSQQTKLSPEDLKKKVTKVN